MQRKIVNPFIESLEQHIFSTAIKSAISYDCMIGFFSSSSFKVLAETIAYFLNSNINNTMRFIISPNLSIIDLELLKEIYTNNLDLNILFQNFEPSPKKLKKETLKAIAYLIKQNRIEFRIAIPKNGLFHVKCWLFKQKNGAEIIIHGSGNHTANGLSQNFEYLVSENSENSPQEKMITNRIRSDFEAIWNNNFNNITSARLTLTTINVLLETHKVELKSTSDKVIMANLTQAIKDQDIEDNKKYINETGLSNILNNYSPSDLSVPSWLDYRSGDYSHQGEAIDAWFLNNHQGILSIATGGGKTLTSLTAATLLSRSLPALLIIIAVPTKALMEQWTKEVALFGVHAINLNNYSSKDKKIAAIKNACRHLRFSSSKVECIILSHDALKSEYIQTIKKSSSKISTLLIADEVHNLGSEGFIKDPPTFFEYKLGLSATPIRQYDEDGSTALLNYFHDVVFDFPLKKAIGNCLVPFNYHVHRVILTQDEEDLFFDISQKIKKLSFAATMDKKSEEFKLWSNLCIQRRRIIETAHGKIAIFHNILEQSEDLSYSLIFCSDKNPEQLETINELLNKFHVNYHQITGEETANIHLLNHLVEDYNSGKLKILTSKRVLDEGFNVPKTKTAYLLASNTTSKQWIQRLGRVLRKSKGKSHSDIHDFIVLPASFDQSIDSEFISLLRSEAQRIQFFSDHSKNGTERHGSLEILTELLDTIKSLKED